MGDKVGDKQTQKYSNRLEGKFKELTSIDCMSLVRREGMFGFFALWLQILDF